jgi:hypothetical protein
LPPKAKILNDALSRNPPRILYHYTTQSGLLGIIQSSEIWATHTQYLNDEKEYRHATELVASIITQRVPEAGGTDKAVLNDMLSGIQGIESMNVCVCSFSEERDSLSQWRAYGGSSSGYAIGFNADHLAQMVSSEGFYLAPCLYNSDEKTALLATLVDEVFEENGARVRAGEKLYEDAKKAGFQVEDKIIAPRGGNLNAYLHRFAPILKDEAFSEEREWRIISRPLMCTGERYSFRIGRSMITPYYRFPMAIDKRPMKIEEIIVGPTPHMQQSQASVMSLLVSRDLHGNDPMAHKVTCSSIPYRNW